MLIKILERVLHKEMLLDFQAKVINVDFKSWIRWLIPSVLHIGNMNSNLSYYLYIAEISKDIHIQLFKLN